MRENMFTLFFISFHFCTKFYSCDKNAVVLKILSMLMVGIRIFHTSSSNLYDFKNYLGISPSLQDSSLVWNLGIKNLNFYFGVDLVSEIEWWGNASLRFLRGQMHHEWCFDPLFLYTFFYRKLRTGVNLQFLKIFPFWSSKSFLISSFLILAIFEDISALEGLVSYKPVSYKKNMYRSIF